MPEAGEQTEMPCTCNGINSNCSRCYGSGYVRRPPGWTGTDSRERAAFSPSAINDPVSSPKPEYCESEWLAKKRRKLAWRAFWINVAGYAIPFALVFLFFSVRAGDSAFHSLLA